MKFRGKINTSYSAVRKVKRFIEAKNRQKVKAGIHNTITTTSDVLWSRNLKVKQSAT